MNLQAKRGFTLIELLVVIAIISLLSSIILASLGTARQKAKDASATGALVGLRSEAELKLGTGDNYGGPGYLSVSPTGSESTFFDYAFYICRGAQALRLLGSAAANTGYTAYCAVGESGNTWVAFVQLTNQTGNSNYCVDSSGFSGTRTQRPAFFSDVNFGISLYPISCAST